MDNSGERERWIKLEAFVVQQGKRVKRKIGTIADHVRKTIVYLVNVSIISWRPTHALFLEPSVVSS
jgi:hypothetical protein